MANCIFYKLFGSRLLMPFPFVRNQCLDSSIQFHVVLIWCWSTASSAAISFCLITCFWKWLNVRIWKLKTNNQNAPVRFITICNYGSCLFASFENFHKWGLQSNPEKLFNKSYLIVITKMQTIIYRASDSCVN